MTGEIIYVRRDYCALTLTIDVDFADLGGGRAYRLQTDLDGETYSILTWWDAECVDRPVSELSADEIECVTRWAECSPEMDREIERFREIVRCSHVAE